MHLSLSILRRFATFPDIAPQQLADIITTSIAEVEGYQVIARPGVVVARIVSLEAHPNADRLRVVRVDDGEGEKQVVCGGSNLSVGALVAFARVGTSVKWHGEGEEVVLEKAKLRGIASEGMICASSEIGLDFGEGEREILDLSELLQDVPVGTNLYEALGCPNEVVLVIDNKSLTHRPDLFGHVGFARDLSAVLPRRGYPAAFQSPAPTPVAPAKQPLSITVQSPACPRFCGLRVRGIKVGPSPAWLRSAVTRLGMKSVNNVVDVTNYVMAETGKPIHAYDARFADQLIIRYAHQGERLLALDGKDYELDAHDTVVADAEKALCLGGIIGGMVSSVTADTTSIVIESAAWNAVALRKTAQRLGIRTEASTRLEKDLDPEVALDALTRAVQLLHDVCPQSTPDSILFDHYPNPPSPQPIALDLERAERMLGREVPTDQARDILHDLGCSVHPTDSDRHLNVTPPSWRSTKDLLLEEDLIEELGRMLGYADIPYTPLQGALVPSTDDHRSFERRIRSVLSATLGYHEVENYSLTDHARDASLMGDKDSGVTVSNPLSAAVRDYKVSLLPDLLRGAETNARLRAAFGLFEIGHLYHLGDEAIAERYVLSGIRCRDRRDAPRSSSYDHLFFRVKEDLEILFDQLSIAPRTYQREAAATPLESAAANNLATIVADGRKIGKLLCIADGISEATRLSDLVAFEIDLPALEQSVITGAIVPPPRFPVSTRDMALLAPRDLPHAQLCAALCDASPLITSVALFDIFEGEELGTERRSLAYRLTIAAPDRTLTESEISAAFASARQAARSLGAEERS